MIAANALSLPGSGGRKSGTESSDVPNLCQMLLNRATVADRPLMFAVADGHGGWRDISVTEFIADVRALAKGLIATGVCPQDRVAIMSRTRYEWTLLDFAIMFAGGIPVPIYETSSAAQVTWYLKDSGSTRIFVETEAHKATVQRASAGDVLDLHSVSGLDSAALGELRDAGKNIDDSLLEKRLSLASANDIATIIYTSGTTSYPRGCVLTHKNFFLLSQKIIESLPDITAPGMRALFFLPLAHVFARFIAITCILAGVQVAHTPDTRNLFDDAQSYRPTFLLSVPRVFEKIFAQAQSQVEQRGVGMLFRKACDIATGHSRNRLRDSAPLNIRCIKHKFFDLLIYSKIRRALGNHVKFMVSGGAPLNEDLNHFFRGIGITILEGYGLTETTAPVALNTLSHNKIGTVGRPVAGNAVQIAADGEIYVKGICVMEGYYNRPDLTAAAFTDSGWFKTGDLGQVDADGFLKITGRKKEIIVTAGGKNVNPATIEEHLRSHVLVSNAVVVGDQKPFISVLITLDERALPSWLKRKNLMDVDVATAVTLDDVKQEIQALVDKTNAHFSRAEAIKKFYLLPIDFTQESGHLTPSLKLKRHKIVKDYEQIIDSMYDNSPGIGLTLAATEQATKKPPGMGFYRKRVG